MKNYIANERVNIMTSALHLRRLFSKCIELGRAHGRHGSDDDPAYVIEQEDGTTVLKLRSEVEPT